MSDTYLVVVDGCDDNAYWKLEIYIIDIATATAGESRLSTHQMLLGGLIDLDRSDHIHLK